MPTHVNREAVERRLDRLRERYGSLTVVEGAERLPSDRFDRLYEHARDGYTGGGYAWIVRDPSDAPPLSPSMPDDAVEPEPTVLLVQSRGAGTRWAIPGGGREDGETYADAAVRETREETGIEIDLDDPFLVYRATHDPVDGREIRLHTLWVCFDATYADGELAVQGGELRGAAWLLEPPRALGPWSQFRARSWWAALEIEAPWWEAANPDPYAVTD